MSDLESFKLACSCQTAVLKSGAMFKSESYEIYEASLYIEPQFYT